MVATRFDELGELALNGVAANERLRTRGEHLDDREPGPLRPVGENLEEGGHAGPDALRPRRVSLFVEGGGHSREQTRRDVVVGLEEAVLDVIEEVVEGGPRDPSALDDIDDA